MEETTNTAQEAIKEEKSNKFKYGESTFNSNLIAKYLHDNLEGWLLHTGYKNNQEVRNAISDMIRRIQSGDIYELDYSGTAWSNSEDFTNNGKQKHLINFPNGKGIIRTGKKLDTNGIAVSFLNEAMTAISNNQNSETSTLTPFTHKGLHQAWLNTYFGGKESTPENIEAAWYNRDTKNELGVRTRINRLNEYANFLDSYANSETIKKYNYKDSAYKDSNTYADKIKAAALAARNAATKGDEDSYNQFLSAYALIGGDDAHVLFATTFNKPENNQLKQSELTKEDAVSKLMQETPGLTKEAAEILYDELQKVIKLKNDAIINQKKWLEYYNSNYLNLDFEPHEIDLTKTDKNFDYKRTFNWFDNLSSSVQLKWINWYRQVLKNVSTLSNIKNKYRNTDGEDKLDGTILRFLLYKDSQDTNEGRSKTMTAAGNGNYIINSSIDYKKGTAYVYNPKNKKITKIKVHLQNTPTLLSKLQKYYFNNLNNNNQYKEGGILKGKDGLVDFISDSNKRKKLRLLALKNKASETGRTVKEYQAGQRKLSADPNDNWEIDQLSPADMTRLGAMTADVVSLVSSFVPGYGTAISGGVGITSMLLDTIADMSDKSVSSDQVWKNLGMNIGMTALGLVPGGKAPKLAQKVAKWTPRILGLVSSGTILLDDKVLKSLKKCVHSGKENQLTVDDWKNIAHALAAVTGLTKEGTRALKTSAMKSMATKSTSTTTHTIKTNKGEVTLEDSDFKALLSKSSNDEMTSFLKSKGKLGTDEIIDFKNELKWYNPFTYGNNTNKGLKVLTTKGTDLYDLQSLKGTRWDKGKSWDDLHILGKDLNGFVWNMEGDIKLNPFTWGGTKSRTSSPSIIGNNSDTYPIILSKNPVPTKEGISKLPSIGADMNKIRLELEKHGLTIDDYVKLREFSEHVSKTGLDLRGLSPERWAGIKKLWEFKQGGKINPLQSLKEGGIIYAKSGTKANSETNVKKRSWFKNTLKGLDDVVSEANPYDITLAALGYETNRKLEELGLQKGTSLDSYTSKHYQITSPFSKLQNSLNAANDIMNQGSYIAKNTSDMSLGAAAMLESARSAGKARMEAFADYDKGVLNSIDKSTALEFANIDALDKIKNENSMRLAQLLNAHLDTKMGRLSADFNGITKPFLMQSSLLNKTDLAERKSNKIKVAELAAKAKREKATAREFANYSNNPTDENWNKYLAALNAYDKNQGYKDQLEIYRLHGLDVSDLEEIEENMGGWNMSTTNIPQADSKEDDTDKTKTAEVKKGGRLNQLKTLKSGGSTLKDDGPRKTRSKDLDRFLKAVKLAADSHDKALSRLAAATLLELKRSMGK